jgi:chorismate dehydratase
LEQKIRIGAVSYLNTKPMITGLDKWDEISLLVDYPAKIAQMLIDDIIDIGLVPVAIIPKLKNAQIISSYGIASTGKVASVCLFSDVSIEKIETILLDYQSRTSVQLLKILLKEYWEKEVQFVDTKENFETNITGTTAGLVIGDRAFELTKKHSYVYDLGEAWKLLTGLPFVFAAWVCNKNLADYFINTFNEAIENNIDNYFENIDNYSLKIYEKQYLQKNIDYFFTSEHEKGMELFLSKIN